jgi:histidinol-phosphate aminotransferase
MALSSPWPAAVHGGPDDGPAIRIDFSSNAHPLGPNPFVSDAVGRADRSRYPDPCYTRLRRRLADFHNAEVSRIVVGGSASELIWRITRCWHAPEGAGVVADDKTFGEYLRAARALKVTVAPDRSFWPTATPALHWCCNPDNPTGAITDAQIEAALTAHVGAGRTRDLMVADLAYWPFRALLSIDPPGAAVPLPAWADQVVQLWSPNKLHGLTGVRGAYLVMPATPHRGMDPDALRALAPSWILGADGTALLEAHVQPQATAFLIATAPTLRAWRDHQQRRLLDAGWQSEPSALHYGLWRPPLDPTAFTPWQARLREEGIKVRDAASFGRPGWVRLVCRDPKDVELLVSLTQSCRDDS